MCPGWQGKPGLLVSYRPVFHHVPWLYPARASQERLQQAGGPHTGQEVAKPGIPLSGQRPRWQYSIHKPPEESRGWVLALSLSQAYSHPCSFLWLSLPLAHWNSRNFFLFLNIRTLCSWQRRECSNWNQKNWKGPGEDTQHQPEKPAFSLRQGSTGNNQGPETAMAERRIIIFLWDAPQEKGSKASSSQPSYRNDCMRTVT